jgi:hypothetical protein
MFEHRVNPVPAGAPRYRRPVTSLADVEAHVSGLLGPAASRAGVSFVGVEAVDVLRFGPSAEGLVRYVTLGMSRRPMGDPAALLDDGSGPRAELVLTVRDAVDGVLRALAVLAAMPAVEGVVVRPGSSFDLGQPLWPGSRFTAVLIGDPELPDLAQDAPEPVRFLTAVPITAHEQALKRAKGPAALAELWAGQGIDVRDPGRADGTRTGA